MELYKKSENNYFNNRGIGLVESLIAITLAIILIVSLLTLTNFNIRNTLLVTENQDAINNANQLLENLRSVKDINFSEFISKLEICISSPCVYNSGNITSIQSNADNPSPFSYFKSRKISDNEVEITIITEWKVGNSKFSSPLQTIFTNWRNK